MSEPVVEFHGQRVEVAGGDPARPSAFNGLLCGKWCAAMSATMGWDQDAISQKKVEEAFRKYRRPTKLEGCPCCVGARAHEPLCTVGLPDISAETISTYAIKAMTTWGTVEDFKYFLPRLLQLTCTSEGERTLGTNAADVAAKLTYGRWTTWPEAEQVALREFWAAAWASHLNAPGSAVRAHRFLSDIATLVIDPSVWLTQWGRLGAANATWQLAVAVRDCWPEIAQSGMAWPRRRDETPTIKEVTKCLGAWLRDDAQRERLAHAMHAADSEMKADVAAAVDAYQWLHG